MNSKFISTILFILVANYFFFAKAQAPQTENYKNGLIKLFSSGTEIQIGEDLCMGYPSSYYNLSLTPTEFYSLKNATDINPCDGSKGIDDDVQQKDGTIIWMKSHENCTLINYLNHAKDYSGLLLTSTTRIINSSHSLEIFAVISNETADKLAGFWTKESVEPKIQFFALEEESPFRAGILVLWLVACVCVAIGSVTGSSLQEFQGPENGQQILDNEGGVDHGRQGHRQDSKNVQLKFTVTLILTMVMFISATLLLLYFFYSYLVFFFMAIFCIASGRATYEILIQIVNNICDLDHKMPKIQGIGLHQIGIAAICVALPVTWFLLRHDPYIWILQDLLGIFFCIHLIQTLRIPSLKICTVLLTLLFFYDIFFVFITPFFTANGKSVMVEVATGGDSDESLPLLIKIPDWQMGPSSACSGPRFSLLGFGDIIVPGFLVCFAHAFDVVRGDKCRPYFITAMIGYGVGLSIAFVALFLTQTGQPALLYIVPTTLIPIYVVGICRKQLPDLWRGTVNIAEVDAEP